MCNSESTANKPCLLRERFLALLQDGSPKKGYWNYREVVAYLSGRFKLDRQLILTMLAELAEEGIVEQACGHGIRVKEGG